jgi:hypothetical protein
MEKPERINLGDILEAATPPSTNTNGCWCEGTGQGRYKRSENLSTVSLMEFCPCDVGQEHKVKYQEELDRNIALARRALQADRWDRASCIPPRFKGFRLSTSDVVKTNPALIKALTWVPFPDAEDGAWERWGSFAKRFDRSWFFWGTWGTGKTGLAVSYAHERIFKDTIGNEYGEPYYIHFTTIPDLLTELRATYSRTSQRTEAEVLEFYQKPDCLILDDLGAEQVSNTGWVEDRLYQIIGHRHGQEQQIIFTSNLSMSALAKRIGDRITWRIIEMCGEDNIVQIQGPNLRDKKRKARGG